MIEFVGDLCHRAVDFALDQLSPILTNIRESVFCKRVLLRRRLTRFHEWNWTHNRINERLDGWMNGRMWDKLLFHFSLHSHKVMRGRPNNYLSRKVSIYLQNITRRHRGTDIGATRSNSGFPSSNKIFNIMNYHFHIICTSKTKCRFCAVRD